MGKLVVAGSGASCFVFLVLVLSWKVTGRVHNDDQLLLSDGTNVSDHEDDSFLHDQLKGIGIGIGIGTETDYSEGNSCHQMYGFLPCSTNLAGHIFLIVIYEYLLYCGEYYVSRDARDLFGNGCCSEFFFQLLNSLPEPLVLAASVGLSKNIEDAEEHLSVAFGLLVGSSILLLTLVWGFCIIFGRRKFYSQGTENNSWLQQLLTGSGVVTDSKTSHRAKIMLVSLTPFIVILIAMASSSLSENYVLQSVVLYAGLNCLASLCLCHRQRFDDRVYQFWEYSEIERKMEMRVSFYEVQVLMRHRSKQLMRMGIEMEKKIASNDHNDNMIGRDGVLVSFKEWFFQNIQAMEDPNSHKKFNKVAQYLLEEKSSLMERIDHMVKQAASVNTQDEEERKVAIDRIFKKMDRNESSSVDASELELFLESEEEDHKPVDKDVVEMIMTHLDVDRNGNIDRTELENGMAEWGWEIEQLRSHNTDKEQGDMEKARKEGEWKAIGFVAIGILMLVFLAEPLTHSVQIFSESLNIQPFYISFIFLPMATQARTAFAAFGAVKQKRYLVTSSTFSEIYNKVFMNNLLGFSLLLCVMTYRGLTWHFSAEILTLTIVCGIVGILAGFNSKFPNWTLIIAFPLYFLSLFFYQYVNIYF